MENAILAFKAVVGVFCFFSLAILLHLAGDWKIKKDKEANDHEDRMNKTSTTAP